MSRNPYVQVALTYLRRPLASWLTAAASIAFVCIFTWFTLLGRAGILTDAWAVQFVYFFGLFIFLAMHMKGQFVNSRAHLTPNFRRVHATVAAVTALSVAGLMPAVLSWLMGWHSLGFVAVVVLLFGTVLWVIVKDANWMLFAMMAGGTAFFATEWGPAHFREVVSGHFEFQAAAILSLGIWISLAAGARLVGINEDMPEYHRGTLNRYWATGRMTGQNMNYDGPLPAPLMDWFRARAMAQQ